MEYERRTPEQQVFIEAKQAVQQLSSHIPEDIRPPTNVQIKFLSSREMANEYASYLQSIGMRPDDAKKIAIDRTQSHEALFLPSTKSILLRFEVLRLGNPNDSREQIRSLIRLLGHGLGNAGGNVQPIATMAELSTAFGVSEEVVKTRIIDALKTQPYMVDAFIVQRFTNGEEAMQLLYSLIQNIAPSQSYYQFMAEALLNPEKRRDLLTYFSSSEEDLRGYISENLNNIGFTLRRGSISLSLEDHPHDREPRYLGELAYWGSDVAEEAIAEAYACYFDYLYFCQQQRNRLPINLESLKKYGRSQKMKDCMNPDNLMYPSLIKAAYLAGGFDRLIRHLLPLVDKEAQIEELPEDQQQAIQEYLEACMVNKFTQQTLYVIQRSIEGIANRIISSMNTQQQIEIRLNQAIQDMDEKTALIIFYTVTFNSGDIHSGIIQFYETIFREVETMMRQNQIALPDPSEAHLITLPIPDTSPVHRILNGIYENMMSQDVRGRQATYIGKVIDALRQIRQARQNGVQI